MSQEVTVNFGNQDILVSMDLRGSAGPIGPAGTVTNNAFWTTLEEHGAVGDGNPSNGTGTDDSAALLAALSAIVTAGGGTLLVGRKTYRFDSLALTIPNNGDPDNYGVKSQPPVRIIGAGAHAAGRGEDPAGGSIFLFTGTGTAPRIFSDGQGMFEGAGITYLSLESGSGRPFLHFAATTPKVHHNCFWTNKTGAACDDPPVQIGGNMLAVPWSGVDAPFQGYGAKISDNFMNGVADIYLGMYANNVIISDNVWWNRSGNIDPDNGFIRVNATATDAVGGVVNTTLLDSTPVTLNEEFVTGCIFANNLFEIGHVTRAITAHRLSNSTIIGNQGFDEGVGTECVVHLDSTCEGNVVTGGVALGGIEYLIDENVGQNNAFISGLKDFRSVIPQLLTGIDAGLPSELRHVVHTAPNGILVQAEGDQGVHYLARFLETDAAATHAGEMIFGFVYDGALQLRGDNAGNVTNFTANSMDWSMNGRWGIADGGSILFQTPNDYVILDSGVGIKFENGVKLLAEAIWEGLNLPTGQALLVNNVVAIDGVGAAIGDITVTATSGTLPTANGSVTIADAATPTVTELLEYCRELEAKVEAILATMRDKKPSIAT